MASNMKATPVTMIIEKVRLAFVYVFTPRPPPKGQSGDPKYSVTVMLPKKHPQVKKILETVSKLARDEWGPGADKKLGVKGGYNTIISDGDLKEDYPEFAGHWLINASSKKKPGIVDREMQPIISPEMVYSGVEAHVQVNFYTYENVSKGVSAGLNNIQVLRQLGAFSGAQAPEKVAWPAVAPEAEEVDEADSMLS